MITSAEEFKYLRESDNPEEYNRATHEEAPVQVWEDIINRFPDMRHWVAHNKTVPLEILRILSIDENPDVRSMVSMKRKLNREIKEILVRDPDSSVRNQLANNSKLEDEFLEILSNDPEPFVRETALRKL
jgi:hypothetical protein